jgi:predicted dienelactone hydrolase
MAASGYPEGAGPFPLVLIAHGTTLMTEFSEAGFAYLGELLASRSYIVASVDENFLNHGWHRYGDFKESDIDVRGWLILQHVRVWQNWNSDTLSPLYGKVDMERIALLGHSRGGEAIAAATVFNRMSRYPRNSNITCLLPAQRGARPCHREVSAFRRPFSPRQRE